MLKIFKLIVFLILVVVIAGAAYYFLGGGKTLFGVQSQTKIDETPNQIKYIKDIGQWEFMTVESEEMVDTTIKGVIFDDNLSLIYKGNLRLGIDMSEISPSDISVSGDSVSMKMPKVKLLDDNFIDESQTRVFNEKGKFAPAVKEDLYQRAKKRMMDRALSTENLKTTEDNARTQLTNLFTSFGYKHVTLY